MLNTSTPLCVRTLSSNALAPPANRSPVNRVAPAAADMVALPENKRKCSVVLVRDRDRAKD